MDQHYYGFDHVWWGDEPCFVIFVIFFKFIFFGFIFIWSLFTSVGDRGFNMILWPWKWKEILLVKPSYKVFLSYCYGLPKRIWVASMGTTSHNTSSLYLPIEKDMRTCSWTIISPSSLSHCNLYGCVWEMMVIQVSLPLLYLPHLYNYPHQLSRNIICN